MRHRSFLAVALLAALVSVASLSASTFVKSPAQLAAEQGPPAPSVLTAPVVSQVLARSVVVRGTVAAGSALAVTPTAAQGASALVVTRADRRAGAAIGPGDVLIEVSGRPVIALPGATPAYRDLRPGDTGPDIAELQAALRALGYPDGDAAGAFGPGTKAAVARLYEHLGYAAPTTGGPGGRGDAAALQGAAQAVTAAGRSVEAATRGQHQAELALSAARAAAPADPKAVTAAQEDLEQARQTLRYAREDLDTARQNEATLIATTGVELPLAEFVFVPVFPAHLGAVNGTVGSPVTAPLVTLNTGALVVTGVLNPADQALVRPGMTVKLAAESLNQEADAELTTVGPYTAGTSAAGTPAAGPADAAPRPAGHPFVVTPAKPLPDAWLGQDVRVSVQAARTDGPVLVVPVSAVSTTQDGTTAVTVLRDGARTRVEVKAGLDANGLVEVAAAGGGTLAAGDVVVIG